MTRHWLAAVAAAAVLEMIGCAVAPHWLAPERPTQRDATILLDEGSTASLYHRLRPTGVSDIPAPRHLRPCCDFGYNLGLRYAFLPVLGYRITNLKTIEDVGPHDYDSAVVTLGSQGELVSEENNGLVFTCRGGFIDTAHVRDYADWTIYLASKLSGHLRSGTTIELSNEAGKRRVVLEGVDRQLLRTHDPAALTMAIAQWLAVQLSMWHEIATWYGSSSFPGFPEKASAFSPEDLYSNILGTKIAAATASPAGPAPRSSTRAARTRGSGRPSTPWDRLPSRQPSRPCEAWMESGGSPVYGSPIPASSCAETSRTATPSPPDSSPRRGPPRHCAPNCCASAAAGRARSP
jgi:hypothetical protein